jgi:hypothetical protein
MQNRGETNVGTCGARPVTSIPAIADQCHATGGAACFMLKVEVGRPFWKKRGCMLTFIVILAISFVAISTLLVVSALILSVRVEERMVNSDAHAALAPEDAPPAQPIPF